MADPNLPEFDIQKVNLKTYNNIFKKAIRLAKCSYYEALFNKLKNYIRRRWKTINGILNKTKRKRNFALFCKDGNNIVYNNKTITNKFNTLFANISPDLSGKLKCLPLNIPEVSYWTHNNNFHFKNINDEITLSIVNKLAPKTSLVLIVFP